jgi:DNA end-binding protein Ku
MHTLHHAAEIRNMDAMDEIGSVPVAVKPDEIKLARQVIGMFEAPLNLQDYTDEYREGLQRIIDAKIAGREIVAPAMEAPPKVVNLMEALRKSLDAVNAKKKTPAKAVVAKPAARRKRA